jgi:MFS family permease
MSPVLPAVLRHRDFDLYWGGVVLSQVGTRAAVAANLYQVYELSHSTLEVGFVGIAQAVALVVLSPLGGVLADRMDRKRLLQYSQAAALVVSVALAAVTLSGVATTWMVVVSSLLATAAATFDQPARQALIPALVPRHQLVDAIALINPSRELAVLVGPALAGVLIAVAGGPGAVYVFDAATYAVLVLTLLAIRATTPLATGPREPLLHALREGVVEFTRRPIVWQMVALDLAATVFSAYRVLLPAFALDVLHAGPTGYGLLSAAPSAGALIGSVLVFKLVRSRRSGVLVLTSTALYGVVILAFAHASVFWLALVLAGLLGVADAVATTVRHAAVQVETPDELRGRVSAIYQMASRGGPAVGDGLVGAVAGALGPVGALTLGGLVPIAAALATALGGRTVRSYSIADHSAAPA